MNTKKALEQLEVEGFDIRQATLFKYELDFKIQVVRDKSGARDYSEENLEFIKNILKLREQDNGIQTAQRLLGVYKPSVDTGKPLHEPIDGLEINPNQSEELKDKIDSVSEKIAEKFNTLLAEVKKESFQYGQIIGKLEGQLEGLSNEINRIKEEAEKEKLRLYEGSMKDMGTLDRDLKRKENEVQELKDKLENERAEKEKFRKQMEMEKRKTFWQRIRGGS